MFMHSNGLGTCNPILVPLKLQLRVISLRMHRRWLYYTEWYQPGGATCIPELSEVPRLHWATTPAETVFAESYFGVLTDTLKVSGPSVHPLRGAVVAAARHNDVFHVPVLEKDSKAIVAEAVRLEADTRTRKQLRAQTHKKRRADHMVAAAQDRPTRQKADEKRTQKAQKKAGGVAERMSSRGAPASRQSIRPRNRNLKIFEPEFQ